MTRSADIAIVGAGIAGASLAAEIAPYASVLILEAEDRAGYHSTGRSAAFWSETYGGPLVQPLTSASGDFLAEGGFLTQRGAIHLADDAGATQLDAFQRSFAGLPLEPMERKALEHVLPGLLPGWNSALFEASCADIDVAALHAAYLRSAKQAGAALVTGARLVEAERVGAAGT